MGVGGERGGGEQPKRGLATKGVSIQITSVGSVGSVGGCGWLWLCVWVWVCVCIGKKELYQEMIFGWFERQHNKQQNRRHLCHNGLGMTRQETSNIAYLIARILRGVSNVFDVGQSYSVMGRV